MPNKTISTEQLQTNKIRNITNIFFLGLQLSTFLGYCWFYWKQELHLVQIIFDKSLWGTTKRWGKCHEHQGGVLLLQDGDAHHSHYFKGLLTLDHAFSSILGKIMNKLTKKLNKKTKFYPQIIILYLLCLRIIIWLLRAQIYQLLSALYQLALPIWFPHILFVAIVSNVTKKICQLNVMQYS